MAQYASGTSNSASNLKATIESFASSNGWSVGGGVISADGAYIRLTNPTADELKIEGARGGVFSAPDICSRFARIWINPWPGTVDFELFAGGSPKTIWCRIGYNGTINRHLGFGVVTKYGGWTGGQWFHASSSDDSSHVGIFSEVDGEASRGASASNETTPFWNQCDSEGSVGASRKGKCSHIHCELNGEVWAATQGTGSDYSDQNKIHCPQVMTPIQKTNPNLINNQSILTPFQLFLCNNDGHYQPIGYPEHIRFVRMTNYNDGDIITVGSDQWKVYSVGEKNMTTPDGSSTTASCGVQGVAIRYVP